jgi:peroxin-1
MASASSLVSFNSTAGERGIETLEIDPQYAAGLGFKEGDVVRFLFPRPAIPSSG